MSKRSAFLRRILLTTFLALLSPLLALADDKGAPLLFDYSQMKLKIGSTAVVGQIGDFLSGSVSLKDKSMKLVVVTMTGNFPRTCRVSFQSDDLVAAVETEHGLMRTRSIGIKFDGMWSLSQEGSVSSFTSIKTYSGAFTIDVAFPVPITASKFYILYPAVMGSQAALSGK